MPVPRKAGINRASRWTDDHRAALIGHDFFGVFKNGRTGPFRDHPDMAVDYRCREDEAERIHKRRGEAWNDLRDELLPIWIAERPFTRPAAWWQFDAPEKRQCVNAPHPHDTAEFKAHCDQSEVQYPGFTKRVTELTHGMPRYSALPGFAKLPPGNVYESERDYLIRLDLLTDIERELLAYEKITPASPSATANATS